ncbi:hypothetical protein PMAYCL1PPCAC_20058, partial [Pristionchus mayeri]
SHNDLRPDAVPLFVEPSKSGKADDELTVKVPDDIKLELVDIKVEPIDEFAGIKQEEPMADIYCPSTGNSRPVDQMNLLSNDMEIMEKPQDAPTLYSCTECGKKLYSNANLEFHMRLHKEFACPYCDESFRNNFLRRIHILSVHKNQVAKVQRAEAESIAGAEKAYVCRECGKKLYSKPGFYYHVLMHSGN